MGAGGRRLLGNNGKRRRRLGGTVGGWWRNSDRGDCEIDARSKRGDGLQKTLGFIDPRKAGLGSGIRHQSFHLACPAARRDAARRGRGVGGRYGSTPLPPLRPPSGPASPCLWFRHHSKRVGGRRGRVGAARPRVAEGGGESRRGPWRRPRPVTSDAAHLAVSRLLPRAVPAAAQCGVPLGAC